MIEVHVAAAVVVAVFMLSMWVLSLLLRNFSFVSIGSGLGYVLVAGAAGVIGDGDRDRRILLFALVALWGLRTAVHLWGQFHLRGADFHLQLREQYGDEFWLRGLLTVFGKQCVTMLILSLPVQLAAVPSSPPLGVLAGIGVILWGFGFVFEIAADGWLRWVRSSRIIRYRVSGLVRYFFGDCCMSWGIWLVAAETTAGRYGIVGPILMTILLFKPPALSRY